MLAHYRLHLANLVSMVADIRPEHVRHDDSYERPNEDDGLVADTAQANDVLDWKAVTDTKQLAPPHGRRRHRAVRVVAGRDADLNESSVSGGQPGRRVRAIKPKSVCRPTLANIR